MRVITTVGGSYDQLAVEHVFRIVRHPQHTFPPSTLCLAVIVTNGDYFKG